MDCGMPGFPVHHQHLEPTQAHVHRVSDAIQLSHPLSSPSPPAFNPSQRQGLFQWVSSSHHVAKGLECQFRISPSNEYSGLISFRIDWVDLLAVQGTLKSLLQHHSSKALIQKKKSINSSGLSFLYSPALHTWPQEKPYLQLDGPLLVKQCFCFLICCLGWSQLFFQGARAF